MNDFCQRRFFLDFFSHESFLSINHQVSVFIHRIRKKKIKLEMSTSSSSDILTVKNVTTAISWEFKNLPPSKLRCSLCLVDCSSTAEGPSDEIGLVQVHSPCGAVVHTHCLKKFQASPSASAQGCPQCHSNSADWGPV